MCNRAVFPSIIRSAHSQKQSLPISPSLLPVAGLPWQSINPGIHSLQNRHARCVIMDQPRLNLNIASGQFQIHLYLGPPSICTTTKMIEITLELKLNSFVVNSVVDTGDMAGTVPHKALRFVCEKFSSVRQLTDDTPSADFSFLSSSAKSETSVESDKAFDEQLLKFITAHPTVGGSRVIIASGLSGYSTRPKGARTIEIGRMQLAKSADQSSLAVDLVPKNEEFDAIWEIVTGHKIQRIMATLVCFKLNQGNPASGGDTFFSAGILSNSLRMMPGN
jgi:hypothetical protein